MDSIRLEVAAHVRVCLFTVNKGIVMRFVFLLMLFVSSFAQAVGPDHWIARRGIINLQSLTIGQGNVMMLGDSLTEQFWWNSISGKLVLNAGLGGAGIDEVTITAQQLIPVQKPKVVVLMVGVNDCGRGFEADPVLWGQKYVSLLTYIHAQGAVPVALNVLPVEQNPAMPLGDVYFNSTCIANLNGQWWNAVSTRGEVYVNLNYTFANPPEYFYMRPGWTTDGVHLTGLSERSFYNLVAPAVTTALGRQP